MPNHLLTVLTALALGQTPVPVPAEPHELFVSFSGFRNLRGELRVSLFDATQNGKGYPGDIKFAKETQTIDLTKVPADTAIINVKFTGLPDGTYAIAALHDENRNHRMDTYWYGKPREGGAASNNPRPRFGPPRWRDARFEFEAATGKVMSVKVQYP